ncbi:MAG: FecCD family ABC transporter permease [Sphingomonadales bacterium]
MKQRSIQFLLLTGILLLLLSWVHLFVLQHHTGVMQNIVFWEFQVPRLVSAVFAGAGLSLSGLLMQNLFQNPMAGPYVLGVNSGASLFISLLILGAAPTFLIELSYVSAAMIGAFLAAGFMFLVSKRVQNIQSLLVIGLMFTSFTGAIESVLQSFAAPEQVKQLFIWNMGSLQQMSAAQAPWMASFVVFGIVTTLFLVKALNAMVLGDTHALQLGIKVKQLKMFVLFITALLAGSITAFCGPIAFVGLAIPNLARALLKTQDHLLLILFSVLAGSCFLVAIDLLILLLDPWLSIPVNVLTAVIGAPYVAYLMLRQR